MFSRRVTAPLIDAALLLPLTGHGYVKLLRPSVLKQAIPEVAPVNELPAVDNPNNDVPSG